MEISVGIESAVYKLNANDILRPVKFAENAEGIIPKFKHKT
jgi:hypothetical protein